MALSDFLARHGISSDRAPTTGQAVAGLVEAAEVAAGAGLIGAVEQRFGEKKTTWFMTPETDASGQPTKDADGNINYKTGTGIPMSAGLAVLGLAAASFLPMSPNLRRHAFNISTGLGAAFAYRKGLEVGQKWLDSKQPAGTPSLGSPQPPYGQSASAMAEQANVKGEIEGSNANVLDLVARANAHLRERAAGMR